MNRTLIEYDDLKPVISSYLRDVRSKVKYN